MGNAKAQLTTDVPRTDVPRIEKYLDIHYAMARLKSSLSLMRELVADMQNPHRHMENAVPDEKDHVPSFLDVYLALPENICAAAVELEEIQAYLRGLFF